MRRRIIIYLSTQMKTYMVSVKKNDEGAREGESEDDYIVI